MTLDRAQPYDGIQDRNVLAAWSRARWIVRVHAHHDRLGFSSTVGTTQVRQRLPHEVHESRSHVGRRWEDRQGLAWVPRIAGFR